MQSYIFWQNYDSNIRGNNSATIWKFNFHMVYFIEIYKRWNKTSHVISGTRIKYLVVITFFTCIATSSWAI